MPATFSNDMMMIWRFLSGRSIFVRRINPPDKLGRGDLHVAAGQILVKSWFQLQRYAVSDVASIQARLLVDFGLEEHYQIAVLLKDGHTLFLAASNESHLALIQAIAQLPKEKVERALKDISDRHVTVWTALYEAPTGG